MMPLEIEVKFYLPDPEVIRSRIREYGAQYRSGTFERNIRFEDSDFSLVKKNALLRLRKTDSRAELTYKAEPPEKNRDFKIHRELEITVSDFDTAEAILSELGFLGQQVYEKYRETWHIKDAVLCLDQMPFGHFLEIEGRRQEIREIANALGLDWDRRILSNYLAIFERLKHENALSFKDVTFENFREVDLDFAGFAGLFEAGGATGN
ncbi:MAG: class IV adenylate cyclase [Desulfobacterales bacterium]